jgi:uncharacterized protein
MWQGSHKKFKEKFLKNYQILSKELDYNLPIIVVTTPNNVKDMYKIYSLLNKHKIDVTFFHFLPMGKKTSYFTYYEKEEGFFDEFADNLLKINQDIDKQVIVQPIDKIVETVKYKTEYGCGMQQDCFKQSFCVEADGNIFICPELSAQNKYPLGNWKTREVYNENINLLKKRMTRVDNDCLKCNYYQYCKSGCMAESLASGGDLFQKTYMCRSWKRIFKYLIDSQPHK